MIGLFFVLGLVYGSFYNVCIYRLPAGLSIVQPGSKCPHCEKPLAWSDNIPLISYMVLKGKCRYCQAAISPRYFLVELLTGVLFAAAFFMVGLKPELILALIFLSVLIVVAFIDLDHKIIPNVVVIPTIIFGFFLSLIATGAVYLPKSELSTGLSGLLPLVNERPPVESLVGMVIGFMSLFTIALVRPGGMGMGDVKLAALMGIFLGYYVLLALFLGFLLGSIAGLYMIIALKKSRKDLIPFGPFLALGSIITLFFGNIIVTQYMMLLQP